MDREEGIWRYWEDWRENRRKEGFWEKGERYDRINGYGGRDLEGREERRRREEWREEEGLRWKRGRRRRK